MEDKKNRPQNNSIHILCYISEKLKRIFTKHNLKVHFKPNKTLKQKLVYLKDETLRLSGVVYAVQCREECSNLYT